MEEITNFLSKNMSIFQQIHWIYCFGLWYEHWTYIIFFKQLKCQQLPLHQQTCNASVSECLCMCTSFVIILARYSEMREKNLTIKDSTNTVTKHRTGRILTQTNKHSLLISLLFLDAIIIIALLSRWNAFAIHYVHFEKHPMFDWEKKTRAFCTAEPQSTWIKFTLTVRYVWWWWLSGSCDIFALFLYHQFIITQ